jgi:hypothetical protein
MATALSILISDTNGCVIPKARARCRIRSTSAKLPRNHSVFATCFADPIESLQPDGFGMRDAAHFHRPITRKIGPRNNSPATGKRPKMGLQRIALNASLSWHRPFLHSLLLFLAFTARPEKTAGLCRIQPVAQNTQSRAKQEVERSN